MKIFSSKIGISIVEILVILLLAAILIKVSLREYQKYIIEANQEFARQVMLQNIAKLEQNFSQKGSYLDVGNKWPNIIVSVVGVGGKPVYSITFYPSEATQANKNAYCLVATPMADSIQKGARPLYVDRFGLFSFDLPDNCSQEPLSTNNNLMCSNNNASYSPCSGNCRNGIYSACSGNCDSVTICAGGTGCSGNCRNSIIYGPCSGNCIDSIIYWDGRCSGNCRRSTCCDIRNGNCQPC